MSTNYLPTIAEYVRELERRSRMGGYRQPHAQRHGSYAQLPQRLAPFQQIPRRSFGPGQKRHALDSNELTVLDAIDPRSPPAQE